MSQVEEIWVVDLGGCVLEHLEMIRRQLFAAVLAVSCFAASELTRAQAPTVVEIAASWHILALLSDGSVVALGENRSGQLGRPKVIRRFLPSQRVDLPRKAIQVATGEDVSYALLDDGTVWAWGRGQSGALGVELKDGSERHTPMPIGGLDGVRRVVADGEAAMAIMADGTVRAWGPLPPFLTDGRRVYPGVISPLPIRGLEDVADVAGGVNSGSALRRDGRVVSWGSNAKGQLGTGSASAAPLPPTEVSTLREVVSIARVSGATAAVTRDGRVWTWGDNGQAGLGNGLHADTQDDGQATPQPVKGIVDAVEVKAGTYGRHFIVRRRNATLIGWGNSDWGQLGAGISGDHQPTPTAIKLPNVDAYWLGGNFSFARTKDGALWFWGEEYAAQGLLGTKGNRRVPVAVPIDKFVPAP